MEQPFSTSKVTVEYFDPHGVYKLLAPGLVPRLPLRNLHWQSHAGPLRSIDALHVELLTAGSTDPRTILSPDPFPALQRTNSSNARDDGFQTQIGSVTLTDAADKHAAAGQKNSTPARRHQIPGLRRTPYLKVLFVRCDDNDSYKASVRQEIRDWVKANTRASGAKKANTAENHDAFEWLILHVVIPNTVAATQPRVTGKTDAASEKSSAVPARWRTGSSTLLEKLRSDFNSSSKGGVDRVAQIRIGINDVPYDLLPRVVPAVPSGYKETGEESDNAWTDLISKIRSLILSSFDSRVSQYEEDIKEKDAQRSLPGWNFCTFFILKEGLARGFESVGLVEDALVVYDELSVGLDMVIKDQARGGSSAAANTMLNYTQELREAAVKARAEMYGDKRDSDGDNDGDNDGDGDPDGDEVVDMQASVTADTDAKETFDDIPISATKKPYRELILENNVSVFDFRCYIFARQIALLLRLGNAWSTREELLAKLKEQQESTMHGVAPRAPPPRQTENEHEDLSILAEICRRTMEFIPAVSHVMRGDILSALTAEKKSDDNSSAPSRDSAVAEIMDNLVAAFAFSIAQQILAQTSTKALPIPPSILAPPDGHEPKSSIPEPKTMMHPSRNSSLRITTGGAGAGRPPQSPNFFPGPGQNRNVSEHEVAKTNAFLKVGLEELASRRAELYVLSRNILEECGKKRGWSDGWTGVPVVGESSMVDMVEISLDADTTLTAEGEDLATKETILSLAGLNSHLLRTALDNDGDFYRLYEMLTDKALRHYTVANHTHSVQASMADLAVLKYHLRDYAAAASYFWRTTPFFGESGWSLLELSMLIMYSRCLKQLQRKDEYVKVTLKLLSKAAAAERQKQQYRSSLRLGKTDVDYPDSEAIKGLLADLLAETKTLQNTVRVPLANFFSALEVDGSLEYHVGRDSFSARLKLFSVLVDEMQLEKARVRLVSQVAGVQKEILLSLSRPTTIKPGRNRLDLSSNMVLPGIYDVDKIDFTASNLCMHYDREANKTGELLKSPKITIFHRAEALNVSLSASTHIQLDRNNTVDINLDSGWNNIVSAEVRVKAATGGMRLLTAEAKCIESSFEFSKSPTAGLFSFAAIPARETTKIRFPYTNEQEVTSVSIRIDVSYTTEHGTFTFSKTPTVPITLALGVNVQDVFKHSALFSRFTVSTASESPLRLYKSELIDSELFQADFGVPPGDSVVVFPRLPASLLYKIRRKKAVKLTPKTQKTLFLKLDYSVLGDDVLETIRENLTMTLKDTALAPYGRLLSDTIVPHFEACLGPHELERACLLGYVDTGFLSSPNIDWTSSFTALGNDADGRDLAIVLSEFIRKWQTENSRVAIQGGESKSILIPVDVPSISIVHTVDIRVDKSTVMTNQLLPATLHLKWTRVWDTTPAKDMVDLEFSYEVVAPADTWLVGGRRKGHFVIPAPESDEVGISSTEETEADIPLLLIPLREGWLPYPSIEIREVRPGSSADPSPVAGPGEVPAQQPKSAVETVSTDREAVSCETDFKNLGETIRVVADRERVTLSLDASGPGGGPLVMEVVKRVRMEAGEEERVVV
ncbi:trafficking protein particle complex subunit 10 [Pseudomassariella vexata]|uniref:Trafficking protein particle complex subunit 10 n=1 Tax=Pseudomassariella vexata TaxID=1141098 RepID=A0A1Y2E4V8_9PEZI|nr:trafficking protein particle complex subunit 10 [Pseudomassariella vexata]ORY66552.1 trafficking protein particle complex subunit 10 [Pseudomassariella vexata]